MFTSSLGIDHWRQIVDELDRSGLTVREFGERNGLTVSSIYYWRRRLLDAAATRSSPSSPSAAMALSFVEVQPTPLPASRPPKAVERSVAQSKYEVRLQNGRTVTVPEDFDSEVLGRLLVVVEGGV